MAVNMLVKDAVLLLLFMGYRTQIPSFSAKVAVLGLCLPLLLTLLGLVTMLVRALTIPRQLVSLSDKSQTVLGKPLLLPVKFNHTRLTPVKDRFANYFLLVGVPVGLRCRIGNLLAVDDASLDLSPPPGEGLTWNRLVSRFNCWFTFDSARYLHRGDHGVDLREKLDAFLLSQNEDPVQWPYAYLLSTPRFHAWCRSVVTWWYLYSEKRELEAVIMEINNSYDEKRNYLMKVKPNSDGTASLPRESHPPEYLDNRHLVQSLPPTTPTVFYHGGWAKYVFASPFEKVDGLVSNRMIDPLQLSSWKANTSIWNMTTTEESGEVRMTTRLTCEGPPIDPTTMNAIDVAKLIFRWTLPGVFTTGTIIFKALKIRITGSMKMNSKPPVRSGSVGRPITKLERDLEPFFRSYLASAVENCSEPVEVTYLPCRSFTNDTISMRSPSYRDGASNARSLTVEPADPQFYTKIVDYPDVKPAVALETKPTGHIADPTARRLIVSDSTLLTSILESASSHKYDSFSHVESPAHPTLRRILLWCRWNSTSTFMDDFALSSSEPSSIAVYMSSTLRLLGARKLALGSQRLFGLQIFVVSCLVRWLVLDCLFTWSNQVHFPSTSLEPGWTTNLTGITGYFLLMRLLAAAKHQLFW